jgi:hypothetical protein
MMENKRRRTVAIYHLHAQVIGRSGGRSAVAAAAYRAGQKIESKATGQIFDYKQKGRGVEVSGIVLPDGAPEWAKDRAELWNRVEKKENRKNSQFCREFDIALPHEATRAEQEKMVRAFIKENITTIGLGADFAIHTGRKSDKFPNDHAHVLMFARGFDLAQPDGWATNKNRIIDDHDWLKGIRKSWENNINGFLKTRGLPLVSCETLEAQGITDRAPQLHQGPTAANMERKGKQVDRKRHIDLPAVYEVNAQELGDALAKDPEYKRISTALYFASIDPKDWPEIAEKYKRTERMNNQLAFVEAVREWAPERKKALVKEREKQSETIDEIKGQEPKQGRMAKIFQEDYEKYEKKHNEWAGKYNNVVETYNANGDEIKRINEALKEPTGQKLYEYGQGIKRAFEKAGKWLETRASQILETASKFADFRAIRESFRAVEPSQNEAVAILREQERQQKMARGKDKDRGHGMGY